MAEFKEFKERKLIKNERKWLLLLFAINLHPKKSKKKNKNYQSSKQKQNEKKKTKIESKRLN